MSSRHAERLARARCALEGLSVADAFGQSLSVPAPVLARVLTARRLPAPPWYFSDNTNMALSVYHVLSRHAGIEQDRLARSLAEHYDRARGYSLGMRSLLPALRQGASWRKLAPTLYGRQGAYGSEAAVRAALVGAYFADDLPAAVEHATASATVTHSHPEAIAGAVAVAAATALAWQGHKASPQPGHRQFLGNVMLLVPPGKVREGLRRARDLPADAPVEMAVAELGNGSRATAQDTVPFALWCAVLHLDDYAEALWLTASGMGDITTTCAIAGAVVVMVTGVGGIPATWLASREPLPSWAFQGPVR
ncbi:MAG: ADP-ribosylglycohydrolase family protein [Anaerolineae bacterium]